ncbi:hypothetical protein LTR22_027753 [Elasticomyces elasticus]|nr:hypothetical protein LTR22_027753 [Elasticomyces elasticus]KAK4894794.1 hypothetical protein LTR49_028346 [Elasticomyces elasticus]KAK5732424.1 hypothetical protein LTS12_027125 [Elasticomyces elasticus]
MADTTTLTSYNPRQNSKLLSLTPELRNRIYHYVFCISDGDDMVFLTRSVPANKAISHQIPSESSMLGRIETSKPSGLIILQTCRQILNEAEALFFHLNHFTLPTIPSDPGGKLKVLTTSLATLRRSSIRTMTIMFPMAHYLGGALWQLSRMTGLRTIRFIVYPRYAPLCADWAVQQFEAECNNAISDFPDLSFVQEFAITTTYTDDAYVSLVAKWDTRFKALICSTQEH